MTSPRFSIIIPTCDRPSRIALCLEGLARLDYPKDGFEVIVVDDGSEPPLDTTLDPSKYACAVSLISQPNAGPATARNTGAERAAGAYLAFTDDDCEPAADWLSTLEARFEATPDCAVGGRTINRLKDNIYSTASQLMIDYLYAYYNADQEHAQFLASNNLAFPADRFCALGGFDTFFPLAAAEDRELCDRWLSHGYRMIYAPEVKVYHSHRLTLRSFWRQHTNYGRGAFHFYRIHMQRTLKKISLKSPAFYRDLLRYPFLHRPVVRATVLALLLILSQAAMARGFFGERY